MPEFRHGSSDVHEQSAGGTAFLVPDLPAGGRQRRFVPTRQHEWVGHVALAHDYLLVMRGAERTFAAMAECWPEAPIHTLLYDPQATAGLFEERDVSVSYLQRAGIRQKGFRTLLPLFPGATERMRIEPCDVLLTSSSAFAHGLQAPEGAAHVCYCHSPFRYVWHERDRGLAELPPPLRPVVRVALTRNRRWDREASRGVTEYIANSRLTQERIRDFYGRDAKILHPPVAVDRFEIGEPEDYLIVVAELVCHKSVDVALEAARLAGHRIKVVGTGPDLVRLRAAYGETAEFLGRVSDDELARLYAGATAAIVCNVEEFGIAAVEAMAAGRPVVGNAAGGTGETVIDGETGVLVDGHSPEAFAEALRYTDFDRFIARRIRGHAVANFSEDVFKARLRGMVAEVLAPGPRRSLDGAAPVEAPAPSIAV